MTGLRESDIEAEALNWSEYLDYAVLSRPDMAPGEPGAERRDYREAVLERRLRDALTRLNPKLPLEALEDARPEGTELIQRNRSMHRLLVGGVTVEYRTSDGHIRGAQARVIDFDAVANNDWLAVNQFTVTENKHTPWPSKLMEKIAR